MSPGEWSAAAAVGGSFIMGATLDLTFFRPKRSKRKKFTEKLMGNDGADGLPKEKSIFERLDDQDAMLRHLIAEFPKNGVPARERIDQLRAELKSYVARDELASLVALVIAAQQNNNPPREG